MRAWPARRNTQGKELTIEVIRKIGTVLTKPRHVVALIVASLAACLASVIVPQVGTVHPSYFTRMQETSPTLYFWLDLLGMNRVFTSRWFFLLVLLLILSLGFSLVRQYRKAAASFFDRDGKAATVFHRKWNVSAEALPPLKEALRGRGFREEEKEGEGLIFRLRKNRWSLWGTFLFHGGLLLIILAALLNFAFQRWGFVQLIEGDGFSGREEDFLSLDKGMLAGRFDMEAEVFLKSFLHSYWETGELRELASMVVVRSRKAPLRRAMITKSSPLFVGGMRLHQSGYFGYAVKIESLDGDQVSPGYFLLDMAPRGRPLTGRSDFPATGLELAMELYPDRRGGTLQPVDPLLAITFLRGKKELARYMLHPGDEGVVEGRRFRFAEVRSWSGLIFTDNRFIPPIYFGYILVAAGLIMAFIFPFQQMILVAVPRAGRYDIKIAVRSPLGRKQLEGELMALMDCETEGYVKEPDR